MPTPEPTDDSATRESTSEVPQRKRRWWLWIALAILIVAITGGGTYVYEEMHRPRAFGVGLYEVAPGARINQLADEFQRAGIIQETYSFVWWARLNDSAHRIKAGKYQFAERASLQQVLQQLVRGDVIQHSITFIEGWTFRDMRRELAANDQIEQTSASQSDADVMAQLGFPDDHPEGRFFPDTYRFTGGVSDILILRRAQSRMADILDQQWQMRDPGVVLKNAYETLILASIIEKETGAANERELIAGVMSNRLRLGIRLQTDPTVIYGLGEEFDGNLTRRHLRTDHAYNTYTRSGLPPTPIAMPGLAAIHAALHPAETKALYFVSRGDGSHEFSENLQAHQRAVRKFQLGKKD